MTRPQIKFSHLYEKLRGVPNIVYLLRVETVNIEDLAPAYVHADTLYYDQNKKEQHYYLEPKGRYLQLSFVAFLDDEAVKRVDTLRPWTAEKEAYYTKLKGQPFDVVIK